MAIPAASGTARVTTFFAISSGFRPDEAGNRKTARVMTAAYATHFSCWRSTPCDLRKRCTNAAAQRIAAGPSRNLRNDRLAALDGAPAPSGKRYEREALPVSGVAAAGPSW